MAPQQFKSRIKRQRRVILAELPAVDDLAVLEAGDEGAALTMAMGLSGGDKESEIGRAHV